MRTLQEIQNDYIKACAELGQIAVFINNADKDKLKLIGQIAVLQSEATATREEEAKAKSTPAVEE